MRKNAYILLAALGLASCNYLEIEPVGKVIPHKTSEYRAPLTEGYSRFPYTSSKAYTGLLSDEVGMFHEGNFFDSSDAIALSYNYTWQYETQMWEYPYQYYYRAAFQANAVIDGVADADDDSSGRQAADSRRSLCHARLRTLRSGEPLREALRSADRFDRPGRTLSTYIDIEQKYRPTNVAAVYRQIVEDIEAAERTMTLEKQESPTLNYRFSLDALAAFKARVMLYMRNWQAAYDATTSLLPKYELVDFNASPESGDLPWKATSPEAILAWERPFGGGNGDLRGASILSDKILGLLDEATDNRRNYLNPVNAYDENWTPTLLGYCVNRSSSDRVSIRIAEMYLIAAEAGSYLPAELEKAKGYLLDLKAKRLKPEAMETQRTKVGAMDAEQLRAEIADERARELIGEGHRWMDLRRTTRPAIVKTYKDRTYTLNANDARYTPPSRSRPSTATPS